MGAESVELPQRARAEAQAALARAGVEVRELSRVDDLRELAALLDAVWQPDPDNPPMTSEILRALSKSGNYVVGAYDSQGMLGACVGFFTEPRLAGLHSHIAAVASRGRGRGVGHALKLHQRAWALRRGVTHVSWTFDPLVRRNAYFNLVKLSAVPTEYLPDFYGRMGDAINGGDRSDRLLVSWDLCAPHGRPLPATGEVPPDVALGRTPQGAPVMPTDAQSEAAVVRVAVPTDIERLRHDDPGLAAAWRSALREVLGGLMAEGLQVTGFERAGWYQLRRRHHPIVATDPPDPRHPAEENT